MNISFLETCCAICGASGNARERYPANFEVADLNPEIFSARRLPDQIHYRIVECLMCGLVRSDPVVDQATLAELYRRSSFDYAEEVSGLRRTYRRYLARLDAHGAEHNALLEVGCGTGFFLEEALAHGYRSVEGVEPSVVACRQASAPVKSRIRCDVMRPGLFEPESFDAVCLFQVFDHLAAPAEVLHEISRVLRPKGLLLLLNHNINSLSSKLLGRRSPIIDIEHTYLYSPSTLRRLVEDHGFESCESSFVWNEYSLKYLTRLLPAPPKWKRLLEKIAGSSALKDTRLNVPLGNLYSIFRNQVQRQNPMAATDDSERKSAEARKVKHQSRAVVFQDAQHFVSR